MAKESRNLCSKERIGMNAVLESQSRSEDEALSHSQGDLEALDILFSRYRRTLSLVAHRVLGNHEEAKDAVQNCLRTAADNVPRFEHEGAFRCWLARVLIDEAVILLNKQVCHGDKTSSLPAGPEDTADKGPMV
jgi:DNA-directed RNA polymerase specialized sigma24 family protein